MAVNALGQALSRVCPLLFGRSYSTFLAHTLNASSVPVAATGVVNAATAAGRVIAAIKTTDLRMGFSVCDDLDRLYVPGL